MKIQTGCNFRSKRSKAMKRKNYGWKNRNFEKQMFCIIIFSYSYRIKNILVCHYYYSINFLKNAANLTTRLLASTNKKITVNHHTRPPTTTTVTCSLDCYFLPPPLVVNVKIFILKIIIKKIIFEETKPQVHDGIQRKVPCLVVLTLVCNSLSNC